MIRTYHTCDKVSEKKAAAKIKRQEKHGGHLPEEQILNITHVLVGPAAEEWGPS